MLEGDTPPATASPGSNPSPTSNIKPPATTDTGNMEDTVVEPYRNPSNSVENRVGDLLARLTLQDKAGLMFHDIIAMRPGGRLMGPDNPFGRPATEVAVRDMRLTHFNLAGQVDDV